MIVRKPVYLESVLRKTPTVSTVWSRGRQKTEIAAMVLLVVMVVAAAVPRPPAAPPRPLLLRFGPSATTSYYRLVVICTTDAFRVYCKYTGSK